MAKDKCVICGVDSQFDVDTHVDYRSYYVEGSGQLCRNCHNNTYDYKELEYDEDVFIEITADFIKKYPNDQELGQKIREIYHKK